MGTNTRRELITVITVMGSGVLAVAMLQPVLPLYLISIGQSPEMVGFLFSMAMVGMVLGESGWGWVADRRGVLLPLHFGTTVCALVVLGFVLTSNTLSLFFIFFFWGAFRSAVFGPGRGFIGAAAPMAKKATFMAIIAVMLAGSRSLGALPSGFLADNWGFHTVIYVSSGMALLGGFILLIGLGQRGGPKIKTSSSPDTQSTRIQIRSLIPLGCPLAAQCLVASLQYVGLGVFVTFLPLLATQVVGLNATRVGILFTLGGMVSVLFGFPMGMLADRIGKKITMVIGLILSALAMSAMPFAGNFVWLIGFVVFQSIGMVTYSPAALGLLSETLPARQQSTVMGIYGGLCENSGFIVGSALGGLTWSTIGPRAAFLMGGIASLLGAIFCLFLVAPKKQEEKHFPVTG